MRRLLPALLGFPLLIFIIILYFNWSKNVSAAPATHLVISEIQVAGASTTDEFVEFYNPTGSDVDLSAWKLGRKTSSGSNATDLVSSLSGTIKSHGYFLIASDSYAGSVIADATYASASSSIANNNSVTLYDSSNSPVDLVGLGSSTASETATIGNPATGKSVERKANSASDATSMGTGGIDEFAGNGEDTDNNSLDFVTRNIPAPQNSQSLIEPAIETPTPTLSPAPTEEPSPSPSPTIEPSPTLTLSPAPSVSPSPSSNTVVSNNLFTCNLTYKSIRVFNKQFFFPIIRCVRN